MPAGRAAASPRRSTSRCGSARRGRRRSSATGSRVVAGLAAHDVGSPRCGAAAQASANFDENSPNTRCWLRCSTRPNVATSQNTVVPPLPSTISQPSGSANRSARPGADGADEVLHRRLAVRRAERSCVPAASEASSCSGRTLDGPHPKRPSAGQQSCGHAQRRCGVGSGHCASMAAGRARSGIPCHVPKRVSARLAAIAESATLAVDAKAKALQAQGENVIGFGAGEPDFPTPEHIVEAAVAACRDPKNHRYTPAAGLPELKEAIAAKTKRDCGFECTAAQVLVTNGGKHAVFTAFAALCDPGRRGASARRRTGRRTRRRSRSPAACPRSIDTTEETGFQVTVDQLEAAYTERTKALLFVSPDNPSGAVYPPEQVEAIGQWAVERGVWVITDEIYEHLTYGPHEFSSMPSLVPDLAEQCVIVNGVAKTYAMTGWRVGWMIGPNDVVKAATNFQSHATSNVAQRRPAGRARRGERRPRRGGDDARGVRAPRRARCTRCCPTSTASRASSRRARSTASRTSAGCSAATSRGRTCATTLELADLVLVGGQGGVRPRRGVRRARLRPVLVRPRRRRPRRRHPPPRRSRRWPDVARLERVRGRRRRGRWRRTRASASGITDRRLPRASRRDDASSGIARSSSRETKRSLRTGATVTQSQRGSAGSRRRVVVLARPGRTGWGRARRCRRSWRCPAAPGGLALEW